MRRLAIAIAVAACAPTPRSPRVEPVPWAASGVDWSEPPHAANATPFVPPAIDELQLRNGLRVLVVADHRLPIVSLTVLELAAGSRDDRDHPGVAALTAELLDAGAGARDRLELADALERLGARLELDIAADDAAARVTVLSEHFAAAVELVGDAIRRPIFDEAEVTRVRVARIAELAERDVQPRTVAAQLFDRIVFGAHPYAHPAEGTAASVAALTAADVCGFHARAYGPATTTILVAGDVELAQVRDALDHAFGDWTGAAAIAPAPAIAPHAPELAYVDVPGATQTSVMIGRVEPAAGAAAEVANAVLGGSPTARLDRTLRDELHVATGAGASFWSGAWSSTWAISTTVTTERTAEAIHAALALVDDARTAASSPAELSTAQQQLVRAIARSFETATSTTRAIEHLVTRGVPVDPQRAASIAEVTPEAARAAIAPLWTDLTIVVIGDWARIGPGLRALDLPLPIRRYDADGRRL